MIERENGGNNLPQNLVKALIEFKAEILETIRKEFKKTNNGDEYLMRKDVARNLKVDVSTIDNWARNGKLTKYLMGGRVYFKKSEIDKALCRN